MNITNEMCNWLNEHEVAYERSAVEKIKNVWERNKADLLEKFRKHPNWDEENLAIVFKESEYERALNTSAIDNFNEWVDRIIRNELSKVSKREEFSKAQREKDKLADAVYYLDNSCFNGMNLMINGEPARTVLKEKYDEAYTKYAEIANSTSILLSERVDKETEMKYRRVIYALREFKNVETNFASEELLERVNHYIPEVEAVESRKYAKQLI